jgi:hypothetical protein
MGMGIWRKIEEESTAEARKTQVDQQENLLVCFSAFFAPQP